MTRPKLAARVPPQAAATAHGTWHASDGRARRIASQGSTILGEVACILMITLRRVVKLVVAAISSNPRCELLCLGHASRTAYPDGAYSQWLSQRSVSVSGQHGSSDVSTFDSVAVRSLTRALPGRFFQVDSAHFGTRTKPRWQQLFATATLGKAMSQTLDGCQAWSASLVQAKPNLAAAGDRRSYPVDHLARSLLHVEAAQQKFFQAFVHAYFATRSDARATCRNTAAHRRNPAFGGVRDLEQLACQRNASCSGLGVGRLGHVRKRNSICHVTRRCRLFRRQLPCGGGGCIICTEGGW